jgi:Carboxypeptidase regulatory-like domain
MTTKRWLGPPTRWVLPAVGLSLMSVSCGVRPAATNPAQSFSSTSTTTTTNANAITSTTVTKNRAGNNDSFRNSTGDSNSNSNSNSNSTATTVAGVVVASPGCPVEQQDHACQPRVLGTVRVEARHLPAGVTATTRTGADGRYSLRLAPGRYVLNVVTDGVFPRCAQVTISVRSARPVRADITCDSGIR